MTCPDKVCDNSAVTATLSGELGTFTFTEYVKEGDLIDIGKTQHEHNIQRSNTGDQVSHSGDNFVTQTVSMNIWPCDPVFEALYAAYVAVPMKACFDTLIVNDPCCTIRKWKDVFIEPGLDPSNVSNDDRVSVIDLVGTVVA